MAEDYTKKARKSFQEVIKETLHNLKFLWLYGSFTLPDEEAMHMFCKEQKILFMIY